MAGVGAEGVLMQTENSNTFLDQIETLAPKIFALINSKSARITAAITSHDVTGGYGRGFTFNLKLEILIHQCVSCGETQFSKPNFNCTWHNRSETRFMQVADAEAATLDRALIKLEAVTVIREQAIDAQSIAA